MVRCKAEMNYAKDEVLISLYARLKSSLKQFSFGGINSDEIYWIFSGKLLKRGRKVKGKGFSNRW